MLTPMTAVTHPGVFHADDVFSYAFLMEYVFPGYGLELNRTRDPKVIEMADIAFDVGGVYDIAKKRFDHHQKGGAGARPSGIRYASFGLLWAAYAPDIFGEEIAQEIDGILVEGIDALDNGQAMGPGQGFFLVSHAISALNPTWQQQSQDFDGVFRRAVEVARLILRGVVDSAIAEFAAVEEVLEEIKVANGSPLVILDHFLPWKDTVENEPSATTKFVVFPAPSGDQWNAQCVPVKGDPFTPRHPFPASWAGLSGKTLAEATGVADAVFCHAGRFIAAAKSREGAVQLARQAGELYGV